MSVSIPADLQRSNFNFLSKKWHISVQGNFLLMFFRENPPNFDEVSISRFLMKQVFFWWSQNWLLEVHQNTLAAIFVRKTY